MSDPLPPVLFKRRSAEPGALVSAEEELVKFDEFLRSVPSDYPGLQSLMRRRQELVAAAYGGTPELDLHLDGDTVHGHATDASHLARFMGAASRAVHEVTKSLRGLQRLASTLQVIPGPGSVRLTFMPRLSAPPPGSLTDQAFPAAELAGLRRLASLMVAAQTTDDVTGAEMLAAVQDLTPAARRAVSAFAKAAIEGDYDIAGKWVDPGRGTTEVHLTQRAARRLTDAASQAIQQVTQTTLSGTIDGWEWSSSTVKFKPVVGPRFRAHVPDRIAGEVARLGAQRDLPVSATFTVVTTYGAGSDRPAGQGYTVEAIRTGSTSYERLSYSDTEIAAQSPPAGIEASRRRPMSNPERRVVQPNSDGGWDVVKPGSSRASAHTTTQADAIGRARQILQNAGGGELEIRGRDGRIRDSDTVAPGNDPNPPRDRR